MHLFLYMDKTTKTQIYAFFLPLLMASSCILIQDYLSYESRKKCQSSGGFSFDLYGTFPSIFDLHGDIACASNEIQFFYKFLGVAAFIFIGLSTMLPCIIELRRCPVEQPKIFN